MLIQSGLSSRERPPPVSDHLSLTFWVVAHGRFDCGCLRVFRFPASMRALLVS